MLQSFWWMALCRSTKIKEDKTTPSQIITDHFFSVALFLQGKEYLIGTQNFQKFTIFFHVQRAKFMINIAYLLQCNYYKYKIHHGILGENAPYDKVRHTVKNSKTIEMVYNLTKQ